MPVYQYVVLNGKQPEEIIEVEQKASDTPLSEHPVTKEPVKRVPASPSLSLNHSTTSEKSSLSEENLDKHGFSLYHKDQSDGSYRKQSGAGPGSIQP